MNLDDRKIMKCFDTFPIEELKLREYLEDGLDGHSLVPLLKNPDAEWDYPVSSSYDYSEFSVRTQNWRCIRYIDDIEELYDHKTEPKE